MEKRQVPPDVKYIRGRSTRLNHSTDVGVGMVGRDALWLTTRRFLLITVELKET